MSTLPPPTGLPLPPPPPPPGASQQAAATVRPRHLTPGWRLTLGLVWAGVLSAIGLVANAGDIIGSPPMWLGVPVLPFVLPLATLVLLVIDSRFSLVASAAAALALGVLALLDLDDAPAMALMHGVLAVAAALATIAARAGRVRDQAGAPAGANSAG
jgi:hypothetical protein